jgi:hypothetical protein
VRWTTSAGEDRYGSPDPSQPLPSLPWRFETKRSRARIAKSRRFGSRTGRKLAGAHAWCHCPSSTSAPSRSVSKPARWLRNAGCAESRSPRDGRLATAGPLRIGEATARSPEPLWTRSISDDRLPLLAQSGSQAQAASTAVHQHATTFEPLARSPAAPPRRDRGFA